MHPHSAAHVGGRVVCVCGCVGVRRQSTETMPRLVSRAKPLVAADKTVLKQLLQVQQPSSAGGELRLSPDGGVRFARSGSSGGGGSGRSGGTGASGGDGSGAGSGGNGGGGVDGDDSIGEVPAIVINNAVLRQVLHRTSMWWCSRARTLPYACRVCCAALPEAHQGVPVTFQAVLPHGQNHGDGIAGAV